MSNFDSIKVDEKSGSIIYTKRYNFDISANITDNKSTPNTSRSNVNKVMVNPEPSKSTQFPLSPRYINDNE